MLFAHPYSLLINHETTSTKKEILTQKPKMIKTSMKHHTNPEFIVHLSDS